MNTIFAKQADPIPRDTAHDAVLAVLRYFALRWDRPFSKLALAAGAPLEDGKLAVNMIEPALERMNLGHLRAHKSLADLAAFDLPAMFTSDDGELLILLKKGRRGRLLCYDPQQEAERLLSRDEIDSRVKRDLLLVRPDFSDMDLGRQPTGKHWLRDALSGHSRSIMLVLFASVFINLFALAFSIFVLNVYDRVLPNSAFPTLWVMAIGLSIVLLFDTLLKLSRSAVVDFIGREVDFRFSSALFDRVINTSLAARPGSTGAFINRIGQYEILRDFLTSSTLVIFVDFLFMGLFAYIIALLVGWIVIFPLIAGTIAFLVTLMIGLRSGSAVEAALAESSNRNALLVETLSAPQTVKASRAEGAFLKNWENTVLASSGTQSKIRRSQALASQLTAVLTQASLMCIILAGTYRFSAAEISMGAIVATMMLSNKLVGPINQLSAVVLKTRGAIEAYKTIKNIMELPDERIQHASFVGRSVEHGAVAFKNVRFAYPGSQQFVLNDISFDIQPGEKVGIIGRIGSGKTTIGRLLVNFYPPSEGEILIDGVSISQYHPVELRSQIGLVVQEPELFNGTVRENILLGNPTASDERLVEVARNAGVEEFVARHPMGFEMPVGERGCLLSGGQRQAIALARALLVSPKIMFLDEPSSSMDMATERNLIGHLGKSLAPGHTVLIATHRFSLLSLVSRLIVVDNGRIAMDGPRDSVLEKLRASSAAQ